MGFQTNISPGLTLPDHTTPVESDSESITSTTPTKNRNKSSKLDRVGPFTNNAGFHLVTHRGNKQPTLKSITTAPPRPLRYPQEQYEYSSKVLKTEKKLIQTFLNFPVKKVPEKQSQEPNKASDDGDEFVPIPFDMFDTDLTTKTLLETSFTSTTSKRLIDVETTTKGTIFPCHTDLGAIKDSTEDYGECVQIPPGMFGTGPTPACVVTTVTTKVTRALPIKVKPTTKPIPTLVSNTYGCLANDNNDDDEDDVESVDCTIEIKEKQQTGKAGKGKNNKKKNPGRKARDYCGGSDTRPVVVETREL